MTNAFSGKRIRQNSAKLQQIKRREKRLRRIGLSVVAFADKSHLAWFAGYERSRKDRLDLKAAEALKVRKKRKPRAKKDEMAITG